MSRLTTRKYGEIVSSKREKKGIYCSNFCNNCSQGSGNCEYVKDMIEKLAYYEDLDEQGLLLKLPCKIGDTVYSIEVYEVKEFVVTHFDICKDSIHVYHKYIYIGEMGNSVFATKEEAEKELKRLNNEKN